MQDIAYNCMHRIYRQLPEHCSFVHHYSSLPLMLLQHLLLKSKQLIPPLPHFTLKPPVSSIFFHVLSFLIIFFRPLASIEPLPFLMPFNVRNFFKAAKARSPFLKKSFNSRARSFLETLGASCSDAIWGELYIPLFYITGNVSRAWVSFYNHIMPLTMPSIDILWNFSILCHTVSLLFPVHLVQFFTAFWNWDLNYNYLIYVIKYC